MESEISRNVEQLHSRCMRRPAVHPENWSLIMQFNTADPEAARGIQHNTRSEGEFITDTHTP